MSRDHGSCLVQCVLPVLVAALRQFQGHLTKPPLRRAGRPLVTGLVRALVGWTAVLGSAHALEFYVSPQGSDRWSGTLSAPNEAAQDGPFATLERARNAIRTLKRRQGLVEGVTVFIRGGTYRLPSGLVLSAEDSGTAEAPILYCAYSGESPVLTGGVEIEGWTAGEGAPMRADVSGLGADLPRYPELFWRGQRLRPARYPNADPARPVTGGWAYVADDPVPPEILEKVGPKRAFRMRDQDGRRWADPVGGRVFIFPSHEWWNNIVPIVSYDADTRTVVLEQDCSYDISPGDRYYIMDVREELDAPGEWWLDRRAGTLLFHPGEPIGGDPVTLALARTILHLDGVSSVTWRGITFQYCNGDAVRLNNCRDCAVEGCTVRQAGDYNGSGIRVAGSRNCRVFGCDIADVGRQGIGLSGGDQRTLEAGGNVAENNHITRTGVWHKQGSGISVSGVGNRVARNTIHHVPRWAVGFGGNRNIIELNHLHHVSLETSDTGAIYGGSLNWLSAHGTVIRHNLIHDVIGCGRRNGEWRRPFYSWGIYLDWTAMGVTVSGNIIHGAPRAGIMVHDGRFNRIENNIVVDCGSGPYDSGSQIEASGWHSGHFFWERGLSFGWVKQFESVRDVPVWHGPESTLRDPRTTPLEDGRTMHSNVFHRNILSYRDPDALALRFRNVPLEHNTSDYNLIWQHGRPVKTGTLAVDKPVGPNLLSNPGFEESADDGGPGPGWSARLPADVCDVSSVTAESRSGRRSACLQSVPTPATEGKPPWAWQVMLRSDMLPEVTPGRPYRLSLWLKAAQPDTPVQIEALAFKAGAFDVRFPHHATVGTAWQQVQTVFRLPEPGDPTYHEGMSEVFYVRVRLGRRTGSLWVDDAELREVALKPEWEAWQEHGMDRHSVIADPLFVDPDRGDYRLKPGSPAWDLGFDPIPVQNIGCYEHRLRSRWPLQP